MAPGLPRLGRTGQDLGASMQNPQFEWLIEQSTAYLRACNQKANRHFGIGGYSRYAYNLPRNEIWWCERSDPKVRGRISLVGSISQDLEQWLWAWANPRFKGLDLGDICRVREFGEAEAIGKLVKSQWPADSFEGWQMTSVSARLLEAQGAYLCHSEMGGLFLLYDGLEFIAEEQKPRYRLENQAGADTVSFPAR
jgi:hypothetical protein